MKNDKFSRFESLLIQSQNELGTSILLILAWIAASDGVIDQKEAEQLNDISTASKHGNDINQIIQVAIDRDIDALQLAAEIVRMHFVSEKADLFIEMAIGMAITDGYLLTAENYILRFLADLLGVNSESLNRLFLEATGQSLPEPSDPSRSEYWNERTNQNNNAQDSSTSEQSKTSTNDQKSVYAHSILGLEIGATIDEIKKAYRRLAHIHHPDRYASLGEEAVAAANTTFQRINDAYNYLISRA